jgi:hypothetical protein
MNPTIGVRMPNNANTIIGDKISINPTTSTS